MKAEHTTTRISRRQFVKRSAAAGAALGFPTIIPASVLGQSAPSNLIRIAQIGCGRIARGMDLPGILKHHQLARIVAVCDVDSRRLAEGKRFVESAYERSLQQKPDIATASDYRELIARNDIDAVVVSTPEHWHAQPVLEAALAGKEIWVQKPLTLTIAEGRLVSDVVKSKQRILQVGSQQRSTNQFHRACALVRNGRIGKLKTVRIGLPTDPSGGNGAKMPVPPNLDYERWLGSTPKVYYTEDRVHPQKDYGRPGWLRLNQFTCGMITGWGSHHVDIAHWGMNAEYSGPISVGGKATWPGPDSFWDVHGKYSLELKYPNDVTMLISDEFPNGIRFEGDAGWIWVSRGEYTATASDPTAGQPSTRPFDASNPAWRNEDLDKLSVQLHRSPGWDHHLDWLEAIRARKDPATNAETGHRANTTCCLSWIAMKLGKTFTWDPVRERSTDEAVNAQLMRPERAPHGVFRFAGKAGIKTTI